MKYIGIFILLVLATSEPVPADTNTVSTADTIRQQFIEANRERIDEGKPLLPIKLTPEQDALLVAEGILPPKGDSSFSSQQLFQWSFRDAPLSEVLDFYANISGTEASVAQGVNEVFTFQSNGSLSRSNAITTIVAELDKKRIHLVTTESGTVEAQWKKDN